MKEVDRDKIGILYWGKKVTASNYFIFKPKVDGIFCFLLDLKRP